ncbi:hypothetical protein KI387_025863 [Taxus chinensis]|uniref:RBR-type E3 ubiquitin transferase n=1 Tax=Taxus chinensis TaxID=29808 RepID=A0AA38FXF1_TAXCH|nr:hypothetical protein KI387_025863 [Taxus chinensis]
MKKKGIHGEFITLITSDYNDIAERLTRAGTMVRNATDMCPICMDNKSTGEMFEFRECQHRYCYGCLTKFIESKLADSSVPACPHDGCESTLMPQDCQKFLGYKLMEIFKQFLEIADDNVVYCPYQDCSEIMMKTKTLKHHSTNSIRCTHCSRFLCIDCRVPWHEGMSCGDYEQSSDIHLLAGKHGWRWCKECKQMMERTDGCSKMACSCGSVFCYRCGERCKDCHCESSSEGSHNTETDDEANDNEF